MRAHPVRLTVLALLLAIAIVALVPGLVLWPGVSVKQVKLAQKSWL